MPIVQKKTRSSGYATHQKIQIPVPVHIGKNSAGGSLFGACDGTLPGFRKPPVALVQIKTIRSLERTEIDVDPSVPIDIAQGNPGSVVGNRIHQKSVARQDVFKIHSAGRRSHQREAGLTALAWLQRNGEILQPGFCSRLSAIDRISTMHKHRRNQDPEKKSENNG